MSEGGQAVRAAGQGDCPAPGRPGAAARAGARVDHQPAFVLHATPWRETSLVVEVLTRHHGRIALVARGAKRPTSQFRGMLSPFNPVALSWSGRHDIKSLVRAEWLGGLTPLRGDGLLAAFYMNELLVRLLARGDPHEALFDAYARSLAALSGQSSALQGVLRAFEMDLLRETGHMVPLSHCADGEPLQARAWYRPDPQRGLVRVDGAPDEISVRGSSLLRMAQRDFSDAGAAADARALLRHLIRYHLDGKPLNTRRILHDLRQL
jgi:DNA repair protein RecO (recombination protein O)